MIDHWWIFVNPETNSHVVMPDKACDFKAQEDLRALGFDAVVPNYIDPWRVLKYQLGQRIPDGGAVPHYVGLESVPKEYIPES